MGDSVRAPGALTSDERQEIDGQLLDEVWARSVTSGPPFVVVLLASWPVISVAARASSIALFAYVVSVIAAVLRLACAVAITRRRIRLSRATSYAVLFANIAVNGLALGVLNVVMYLRLDSLDLGIWTMVIAGVAGGATVSLGARPEIFFVYILPPLGALVVAPLAWPRGQLHVIAIAVSVWLVYSFLQVTQYRRSRQEFLRLNMELRTNNRELAQKNIELLEMTQRADRIFSALGDALEGKVLAGRYLLESRIGAGGFAIVFRGVHVELARPLAIKIFRPQQGNDSVAALERFRVEGMTGGRTRHPNIVEVVDAGISDDGIPFIAMELLAGRTLEAELAPGKPVPMARIAPIMERVCRGLAAAHAANVVHRDVKPENIFLHQDHGAEVVKILDFGIAKVMDAGRLANAKANLTSTGDIIGSPYYMAPERLLGRESDASADSYSVGLILYRALTGRLPFEGTVSEIVLQAVTKRPPPIAELAPGVPAEVAKVIMRALEDDPAARPAADEIADTLARAAAA